MSVWFWVVLILLLAIIACIIVLFIIKQNTNKVIVPNVGVNIADTTVALPATLISLTPPSTGTYVVTFNATYRSTVDQDVITSITKNDVVQKTSRVTMTALTQYAPVSLQVTLANIVAVTDQIAVVISGVGSLEIIGATYTWLKVSK